MKTKLLYTLLIAVTLLIGACKPKFDVPDPDKGSMDASRFVAIGSSMTAGFSDGALYYEGQQTSFVNILAEQMKAVGGGEFTTPYVSENSAGFALIPNNTTNVAAKFKLGYKTDCKNVSSLSPVRLSATENYNVFSTNIYSSGPFKNMGVPDAKSFHITYAGYGNSVATGGYYNPYFERMASNKVSASVLSDALDQNPTFFSLCIGINDALSYALAGGAADSLTTQARFDANIDNIVNQLTANGAKGVIGNIPDVTKFPFFTTIPYNNLTLDQTQANSLNTVYTPIDSTVFPNVFKAGANNFVIYDSQFSIGIRPMYEGELIVLTTPLDSVKCNSLGSLNPFHNKDILTLNEIQSIRTAIAGYNAKLQAVAQAKGLAYVDMNAFFNTVNTGVVYNGVSVNAQFVKGGAFSLDGLNLNPIGNALLANEFIKAINKTYNSTILQVDAIKYRGTIFP
ncbi:MAG: hypothetical protein V4506_06045 [Bacteroidota bacterium]